MSKQSLLKQLTREEKQLYFLILIFVLLTLISYIIASEDNRFFFFLFGITVTFVSLLALLWLIPRKPRIIYMYGGSRKSPRLEDDVPTIDLSKASPPARRSSKTSKDKTKACYYCKKVELLPFVCSYCQHSFCSDHRLPERHDCEGLK